MEKKKVELLAPAGDFSCFMAALQAGADAVYLGGDRFGARAYANNFTKDEILEALKTAHLFGKKIYLTVNTLVKESEFQELIPYMEPLVEGGLDGVIIQDLGVVKILRECFPNLELHASTQMTITGKYGAQFAKDMGMCRVVPARELSLEEIREIKEATGLEIETFIHGAMCYGYSGQCLFSSILGGRSGNRGRCAGPCRLPYQTVQKKDMYPLSLKDMYTLSFIPELISAGIDSFKIEGRMKSAEYVAGVTSMYRKYIDFYLKYPQKEYTVSKKDEDFLRHLYIRSDICEGYYKQHNGKNMVTLSEPGYSGCNDQILQQIRNQLLNKKMTIPVHATIEIQKNEQSKLTLWNENAEATVYGAMALEAANRPLSDEDISQKISKLGDTFFSLDSIEIKNDGMSFLPVKAMNELRRSACALLEERLLDTAKISQRERENELSFPRDMVSDQNPNTHQFHVCVTTMEQFSVTLSYSFIDSLSISADLFVDGSRKEKILDMMKKHDGIRYYLAFPHILRKRSYHYLELYKELLQSGIFCGVLIRNLEEYQWCREMKYQGELIADYTIYSWNRVADELICKLFTSSTYPLELNKKEIIQLRNFERKEIVLYSRIPLMYSANCVRKTCDRCLHECNGKQNIVYLTDRYKNNFPVMQNCFHCYNILFNTVPMSLHGSWNILQQYNFQAYRIEFSIESTTETKKILDYYEKLVSEDKMEQFPVEQYTNGHFKRGVE